MADLQPSSFDLLSTELPAKVTTSASRLSSGATAAKPWAPRPATLPNAGYQRIRRTPGLPQACIDLFKNHAPLCIASVLQSFDEGFQHIALNIDETDSIIDAYANTTFYVAYYIYERSRDQIRVRWLNAAVGYGRNDAELLALVRQLASYLGGGTNLRLIEIPVE
ncbi:hypothetical protein HC891_00490 [Candidatus Gracilibacteria bacterium]|nr:hypothetical protein [Candidatus Gracilibacteria bacterium]